MAFSIRFRLRRLSVLTLAGLLVVGACSNTNQTTNTVNLSDLSQSELNTMLIDAAWRNDVDLAGDLINAGANVNYEDRTQQSAYLIATSEGYLALLNLTLASRADVAALDSFNGTGLIRAAERGHIDVVDRLLQTDIDVNHINGLGWTALHEAIILGDGNPRYVETVELLIRGGADLELPLRRDGTTPLQYAESRGQTEIADVIRAAIARN